MNETGSLYASLFLFVRCPASLVGGSPPFLADSRAALQSCVACPPRPPGRSYLPLFTTSVSLVPLLSPRFSPFFLPRFPYPFLLFAVLLGKVGTGKRFTSRDVSPGHAASCFSISMSPPIKFNRWLNHAHPRPESNRRVTFDSSFGTCLSELNYVHWISLGELEAVSSSNYMLTERC